MSVCARLRKELAEAFAAVEPTAPTLCEGWDAHDLAGHVVLRERRLDAVPGMFVGVSVLKAHTQRLMEAQRRRPYARVIAEVRQGPPVWSPFRWADAQINTVEYLVHAADVRRPAGLADPEYSAAETREILHRLRGLAAMALRAAPVTVVAEVPGVAPVRLRAAGEESVTLCGSVVDVALWIAGRPATVEILGEEAAREKVLTLTRGF